MGEDGYFDYAATVPPYPEALKRFEELSLRAFGNPSSSHDDGRQAREALDGARKGFLARVGFADGSLVLTSGATEANNLALRSALEASSDGRLLLASDAHPSAWFTRETWPKRTDLIKTGTDGLISPDWLATLLSKKTAMVSIVHANNETGVVQDLKALGAVCEKAGVPLHVDGVQALGRLPLTLSELPFAYYTFSAHKFGGSRGVGGIIARREGLSAQIRGGGQEKGLRGGTENVAGLAAALVALDLSARSLEAEVPRLRKLAALLTGEIQAAIPDVLVNSRPEGVPGLVSFSFPNLIGEEIVVEMNLRGFAISAGSACGSGRMEPSRPVMAMGRTRAQALGTVRISMGRFTTEDAVRRLAAALRQVVEKQKALA
ncbi:MAG TPA: cysteine desulfurase family protein [Planctomycetota bacterium]|jgi:cysteine desulfurase|nr:cysteine desulfurase family protein [Planctomycetota bacterium]